MFPNYKSLSGWFRDGVQLPSFSSNRQYFSKGNIIESSKHHMFVPAPSKGWYLNPKRVVQWHPLPSIWHLLEGPGIFFKGVYILSFKHTQFVQESGLEGLAGICIGFSFHTGDVAASWIKSWLFFFTLGIISINIINKQTYIIAIDIDYQYSNLNPNR